MDLDYAILDLVPFKDAKGNFKYGLAQIQSFNNKILDQKNRIVLIDKNGTIVSDYQGLQVLYLEALHNNYYYSSDTDILYDKDLNPLLQIHDFIDGVPGQELIIYGLHGHSVGMMNHAGEVIVRPKFEYIQKYFYNGKTIASIGSKNYLISYQGVETELENNIQYLYPGLLYRQTTDVELINYDFNTLFRINDAHEVYNNTTWYLSQLNSPTNKNVKYFQKDDGTSVIAIIQY